MRRRFSLYGFLKNQRYFEPFLWLALLERGLDFFTIGLLVALREGVTVALEVPSGAAADALGRRRAMILSFVAYLAAFPVLGLARSVPALAAGMVAFGVGDAFRTGTHKAMIFAWLAAQGRTDERAEFYGYTRSWSKLGSATSIVIGAAIVIAWGRYEPLFLLACMPYVLGIVNFLGYPPALDRDEPTAPGRGAPPPTLRTVLRRSVDQAAHDRPLRRLLLESMGFEGLFHAVADYLQPALAGLAAATFAHHALPLAQEPARRTASLVGPVYLGLYLLAAFASRRAHRVVARAGDAERGARWLWRGFLLCAALLLAADAPALLRPQAAPIRPLAVLAFVALTALQNLWRPVLVSRIDARTRGRDGATILSLESLARRAATMVWAPALGAAVDASVARGLGAGTWVLGLAAATTALVALLAPRPAPAPPTTTEAPAAPR